MSLQNRIKDDTISAMKSGNKELLSLLRVVSGEFSRISKQVDDDTAIKVLKKMSENAKLCGNTNEVTLLAQYLPTMLTEDELREIISGVLITENYVFKKDMGKVMGYLKTFPKSAQVDGKLASTIAKELLQ